MVNSSSVRDKLNKSIEMARKQSHSNQIETIQSQKIDTEQSPEEETEEQRK